MGETSLTDRQTDRQTEPQCHSGFTNLNFRVWQTCL